MASAQTFAAVKRLFHDRGFVASLQPTNDPKEALGPLTKLVGQFGFVLLGIALSAPGSSSYDPFVIKAALKVLSQIEPEKKVKAQEQLTHLGFARSPFAEFEEEKHECEQVVVVQSVIKGKAVSVKSLRDMLLLLRELCVHRLLICVEKRLTGGALNLAYLGVALEWQPLPLINIVDHVLVPPHRRLGQAEAREVKGRIAGICAQLRSDDAVVRYLGIFQTQT